MGKLDNVTTVTGEICSSIESGLKYVWENHKAVVLGSVAIYSSLKVYSYMEERRLRNEWNNAGKDVVVLHGFPRATTCPGLSPFHLKLETYLRMAGIKYKFDSTHPTGSKGKCPWITLNGKDYTDSELIMEFLAEKFDRNFSSNLTPEQKAVGRAIQVMTDEHIFWGIEWWRLIKDPHKRIYDLMKMSLRTKLLITSIQHNMSRALWAQGLGRHNDEEIQHMMRKDVEAISLYLGTKPFIMGAEPCEVDCALFGMIVQFIWGLPGSQFEDMVQNKFKNVHEYCIRMKEKFWPDWENNLNK